MHRDISPETEAIHFIFTIPPSTLEYGCFFQPHGMNSFAHDNLDAITRLRCSHGHEMTEAAMNDEAPTSP